MKNIISFLLVFVFAATLSGCDDSDNGISPLTIDWENVSKVSVTHFLSGQISEWTINDSQQLVDLSEWFNGLTVNKKQFADGESPGDADGGEVYGFSLESNDFSFSYGIYGPAECYIIANGEWYKVKNPSNPFTKPN